MRPLDPRLSRHAHAAAGCLLTTIVLGLAATALVLAQAGLLAHALASAARGTGLGALRGTLLALLLVVAGRAAVAYGGEVAALRAAARIKSALRRGLAAKALRLGPSWLAGQRAGEITTLATTGLDALDAYFARYLPQLVLACLVPLAVLARVTAADWISGLVIAVTLPLVPLFGILIGSYGKARTQRQWQLLARLGGHFLDVVEGLPTLKAFGRARAQAEVIRNVTGEHRTATMAALRVTFLSALVLELAAALATALVAVEVGLRLLYGHIGYETALLVLLLTPEAYLPLRNVGAQFHASAQGTEAAQRALDILELEDDHGQPDRPGQPRPAVTTVPGKEADLRSQPITLTGVVLTYPGRPAAALDGICLTISPGERIVLTGPNGAGKSSLLGLLLRFCEPASGRIDVGGTELRAIPVRSWRRQIAWVPQRPYLFAGSVAENIALGDSRASPAAIRRAAGLAGAEEFIDALPGGFGAQLTERALTLSAGHRQRIALARAFLWDAPLVLLDEPAAHLDPAAARQLMAVIGTLLAGRTVLLVSHSQQAGIPADRVLRLDRGRLVPAGQPALLAATR
ncbi:thiol reductant ABC exporter subunit CydD [Trebonia sp.]|uniref:thiol reductant ABC exporter subunit CydD n=1 Tax=Trebonia sp. TaxID=2767075 RepID=UPI002604BCF9|nr:thiol reductant ABC exporter subunit CydD [Trebonia sp.]